MPIKRQTYRLDQIDDWQGPVMSQDEKLSRLRGVVDAGGPQTPVVSGRRFPSLGGARLPDLPPDSGEVLGRVRTMPGLLDAMNPARDITGTLSEPLSLANVPMGAPARAGRTLVNGLYSRLDEAAAMIPTKGVPATGVLNWLKKAPEGISLEEVAYRKLPEWLESQGTKTVTPEMLAAHLRENPAPFPQVKTLGQPSERSMTRQEYDAFTNQMNGRYGEGWDSGVLSEDEFAQFNNLYEREADFAEANPIQRTKFQQYQVPGGENYRETLLTLPLKEQDRAKETLKTWHYKQYGTRFEDQTPEYQRIARLSYDRALMSDLSPDVFRSSHYPDYPDLLVHTRANERTLPSGEPGRFVEEVQSDWHQKGVKQGYRIPGDRDRANDLLRQMDEIEREVGLAQASQDPRYRALGAELDTASTQNPSGVPDAPFKENWPDLGLKQQLIEAANDPKAEWMGFTGGKTQADRYDLSKQISKIEYIPPEGSPGSTNGYRSGVLQAYDHSGDRIIDKRADPSELPDLIGKEASEKLLNSPSVRSVRISRLQHELSGLDLQVGGEGMTAFYDQKLPKRLEKIVKPFGGTVEAGAVGGRVQGPKYLYTNPYDGEVVPSNTDFGDVIRRRPQPAGRDNLQGAVRSPNPLHQEQLPMWLSRLTPEMKAAMRERGFPLMSLAGPVAAQGIPDDPNSETDDYARLALNMGSMAALGMAAKGMARGGAPSGGSLAELASKRMSAADAEAAGLWHPIGDGKKLAMPMSEMRFQRDIDPAVASRMPDRRVMRLSDLEGSALVPAIGDRSMAGYTLTGVGGVELPNPVKLEGGRDFMRTHSSQGSVWASKKGVVTRITNQINKAAEASKKSGGTGEVFMVYVPGSHGTTDYSTMMSDALLEQIKGGTFTKKAVREFDAYVRNLRPEWVGLMHPKARTQLDTTTGELRHAFADAVELKSMQDMGFPNIAQTRAAITEPSLMDTPLFSGGSSVAKVDGRIIRDPAIQHSTYDTQMGGTYAGALEKDIPYREMFSDFTAERRASGAPVSGDDRSFQLKFPYQIVTSEWVKKNSGKLQSMGMVAVPVAAGAAAMQSDKPKNGRKTYRLDQIDR